MTQPIAFVSFDIARNETERGLFMAQLPTCLTEFAVEDWSSEPSAPRSEWDKHVHGKIGRCDFMVVLIGKEPPSAAVEQEIRFAKRANVPFFGVCVDGSPEQSQLPEGLPSNRAIPWDWERIGAAVRQLMREGKNHVFA